MTDENNTNIPPANAGSNQAPYGQSPQAPQYGAPQAPQYGAPQYGAPQGQYGGQGYGQQPSSKWNVLSIITLVSSVLGFSIISIVLGIISLNQIKRTGEQGKVLAIIGIILGAIYTLIYIVAIIIVIAAINAGIDSGYSGY
jgi:hypothetical protein